MNSAQRDVASVPESILKKHFHEVRRSKTLEGEYPIDEWLERLRYMADQDQSGDRMRGWATRAMILCFVGLFISFFVGSIDVALILILLAPILVVIYFLLNRLDVPNRLRDSVLPLLTILREDASPKGTLYLKVDLNGPEKKTKHLKESESKGASRKVVETYFKDPWLQGRILFCDGNLLKWEVTDLVRRRKVRKTNYRGKTKTKTKYKIKTRLDVSLGVRRDRYQIQVNSAPEAPLIKKESERKSVLRHRRYLAEGSSPNEGLDLSGFLYTISMTYKCLKPLG